MPPVSRGRTPVGPFDRGSPPGGPSYPPREDSYLLLPFAKVRAGSSFLEVGTGNGLVALAAARSGARVVVTDLNPFALRQVRSQARAERLPLEAVRTDLARGLGRFDRVTFNPPYLPTTRAERDPDRWHDLAVNGGPDGTLVAARWVRELTQHLTDLGEGFLVVSTLQSPSSLDAIWSGWRGRGGTAEVVASRSFEGERLEVWRLAPRPPEAKGP